MTMNYGAVVNVVETPQNEPIFGSKQVSNSAGGYAWAVDDWKRLDRFLILGSEGGTYYIGERKLTLENAEAVLRAIKTDGVRVVSRVVEISVAGRAPKNDPALFVLAMAAGMGDEKTRRAAFEALSQVARTGTHLFTFMESVQGFRGWGRGLRKAVSRWYTERDANTLAYQMTKYRQRNDWSHRDALRLSHPTAPTPAHQSLFSWATKDEMTDDLPSFVGAFSKLQQMKEASEVVRHLSQNPKLTWEMVPSEFLGQAKVWEALLPNMLSTALIRNLGRLTANGLIAPLSDAVRTVTAKLSDMELLRKEWVHPVAVLGALLAYGQGHGVKGNLSWEPVTQVTDALDRAFYLCFGNIEATDKRLMLTLDLSGSMGRGEVAGMPGLTPRMGAAAMALITAATEPNHVITGFTTNGDNPVRFPGQSREMLELGVSTLPISSRQRLDDVVKYVETYSNSSGRYSGSYRFGGTDCSLPMRYALERRISVDAFVMYTDSETWAGNIHPSQALRNYRREMGIPAKLVVVGMVSNEFTVADPGDAGMMDVVGFDTAAPQLISNFAAE